MTTLTMRFPSQLRRWRIAPGSVFVAGQRDRGTGNGARFGPARSAANSPICGRLARNYRQCTPPGACYRMILASLSRKFRRAFPPSSRQFRLDSDHPRSGVLVYEGHEPLGLGRGEVDVVGEPFLTGDADCEPAGAGAEFGLTLGQCAQ